jgi:hypothetical protein
MKTKPMTANTEALARRRVWFEESAEALSDTFRSAGSRFGLEGRHKPRPACGWHRSERPSNQPYCAAALIG